MHKIEYFTAAWNRIEAKMNGFIGNMELQYPNFEILHIHINQETVIEGAVIVNGYIHYIY